MFLLGFITRLPPLQLARTNNTTCACRVARTPTIFDNPEVIAVVPRVSGA